jgi:hypothetical protein
MLSQTSSGLQKFIRSHDEKEEDIHKQIEGPLFLQQQVSIQKVHQIVAQCSTLVELPSALPQRAL